MRILFSTIAIFFFSVHSPYASTLHIGDGFQYDNFEAAAADAQPGDTILFHQGIYSGGSFVNNLQGTAADWIYIGVQNGDEAIIEGGNNAIQLSDPAYLHIEGLVFSGQTANGFNTDDGGTYDSPAHHIIFENCIFKNIAASGNNDLLKLSGLNNFEIKNCTFLNGATGGSGIDMVGCHDGLIIGNYFENMGSNSIQAKGGTQYIRIEANFFRNGGQRTLNLGGSTGLDFFRPIDAEFEAADLQVYSNIIVGSWAAIAYVGSVRVEVINNTIYQPENWVIRILQETLDPDRFWECGDNIFRNNIVHISNGISTETNIGPNTRPETFIFSNNLWYNIDDTLWNGPDIPVEDIDGIIGEAPLFLAPDADDFLIPMNSPAAENGFETEEPKKDFFGQYFGEPRSIGALEANPISAIATPSHISAFDLFPNPGGRQLTTSFILEKPSHVSIELINQTAQRLTIFHPQFHEAGVYKKSFTIDKPSGWYMVRMKAGNEEIAQAWLHIE